jgi:hypothetical protein
MALLMATLENKFEPFRDVGGFNSEVGSDEKSGDIKDPKKDSKKDPENENPSSSTITPLQTLFEMKVKVDIKPYQGEINTIKLNHWLQ